ncbi:MAG: hypothetical protein FI711_12625 [SAR202 cluster bacterium]|jgi:hypothetical protein|nr:hypothetical protein [Chloroflexota bacterium]MCS5655612.1 hypothetical protein [Dehalococcoidia bacterium]MQG50258.1 hypothetical protein [SAR202 cluster bacterium]MBU16250.1 hypothetical protein [Chloroflexota bacterium]MEC7749047.1 hypothetical protein [Chloroflexota bacterium]|tara:strand:- start:170 stop:421 length:252 start_codon:yes stop_codon:yes gene_type:complete
MSWDLVEAGSRVEAVASIPVKSDMGGAPIGGPSFTIEAGDLGEVTLKRKAGKLQWMVIKWDRLDGRTFNLNADQFDLIKPAGN